jgi:hypothetical protein
LLALIGTAINLYLLRVDTGRTRVEEAQLARSILAIIAADIRAATTYQTQDISAIAELAASATPYDVDNIDRQGSPGEPGGAGTAGSAGSPSAESSMESTSTSTTQSTTTLAPGINGTLQELVLDVARLPRLDELFAAMPQQQSAGSTVLAAATDAPRPSDAKTVRYFIRQGSAIDPSDVATTSLLPTAQRSVGGLVRQTIDRSVRQMAEQTGDSVLMESGQMLVAPEVVQIQFRYFDGQAVDDVWDMNDRGTMPPAIEVRIWLADSDARAATNSPLGLALSDEHMYVQTIELPLANSGGAGAEESAEDSASTESEDESEEEQE